MPPNLQWESWVEGIGLDPDPPAGLTAVEVCAGGGGQAVGLHQAGFGHVALVEYEDAACRTLRRNMPDWNVIHRDLRDFDGRPYRGTHLLAGGVPCPPFSVAGKQLGELDDRDLFPEAIRLAGEIEPQAILLENVRGLAQPVFDTYRQQIQERLEALGYRVEWHMVNAIDFGVPQSRPRLLLIALRCDIEGQFRLPAPLLLGPRSVGDALAKLMASRGWEGAEDWARRATGVAPALVGGSRKHGGPDLGPTRARKVWAGLGVDGRSLADAAPGPGFSGMPRLTTQMAAVIQGFPADWEFCGTKTQIYRQIGNAFPPPVAAAVGRAIGVLLRP